MLSVSYFVLVLLMMLSSVQLIGAVIGVAVWLKAIYFVIMSSQVNINVHTNSPLTNNIYNILQVHLVGSEVCFLGTSKENLFIHSPLPN